jgi:transposase-like protein
VPDKESRPSRAAQAKAALSPEMWVIESILLCEQWYCEYGISYRDLAEMM